MKTKNQPSGPVNIQDGYLNELRKNKILTTIFLVSGFQIKCQIVSYDGFTVLIQTLDKKPVQQLIYKHAISTIVPAKPFTLN